MSAVHPFSLAIGQMSAEKINKINFYEQSKQANLQTIIQPTSYSMIGNGTNPNAGTTYPLLYPFLTPASAATIDLDLGKPRSSRFQISITSNDTTINFTNTIRGRGMRFILDITINTATFNSITYSPVFENPPSGLPTADTSRYLLEVEMIKTATEEKYFVVGSSVASAGGGEFLGPWTANHNAGGFTLFNLLELKFKLNPSNQLKITAVDSGTPDGTFDRLEYDADTLGAHDFYVNRAVTTIPRMGITETSVELNVLLDMNNKNIVSINDLTFFETGQSILSDLLGLFYNVPLADEHVFSISGVPKLTIGTILLAGTALDMADLAITDTSSITITTSANVTVATLLSTTFPDVLKLDIPTNKSFIISEALATRIDIDFGANIFELNDMVLKISHTPFVGESLDITFLGNSANYNVPALDTHIWEIGGTGQIELEDGVLFPVTDDDIDLGKIGRQFKDGFFDGILTTDKLALSAVAGEGVSSDLNPDTDLFWNIGSSTKAYSNIYVKNVLLDNPNVKLQLSGTLDMKLDVPSLGDVIISENGTEFVRFDGNLNRSVFKRDLTIDNGRRIRAESSTEIGIFVTQSTATIGTLGSLQVPWKGSTSSNKAGADGEFGAFDGAIAINEIAGTPILIIRKSDGTWWGLTTTSIFP